MRQGRRSRRGGVAATVLRRAGCDARDAVLIHGAGTVGLRVLQVARMYGARRIVADIDPGRQARAETFGADRVIDG